MNCQITWPRVDLGPFLLLFSLSLCLAFNRCCLRSVIIFWPTGESSEEDAGEGVIPRGGRNTVGVTAVRNKDRCERIGVNGRCDFADNAKVLSLFSFSNLAPSPLFLPLSRDPAAEAAGTCARQRENVDLEVKEADLLRDARRGGTGVNGSSDVPDWELERSNNGDSLRLPKGRFVVCERGPRGTRLGGKKLSLLDGVGAVTITVVGAFTMTLTLFCLRVGFGLYGWASTTSNALTAFWGPRHAEEERGGRVETSETTDGWE